MYVFVKDTTGLITCLENIIFSWRISTLGVERIWESAVVGFPTEAQNEGKRRPETYLVLPLSIALARSHYYSFCSNSYRSHFENSPERRLCRRI